MIKITTLHNFNFTHVIKSIGNKIGKKMMELILIVILWKKIMKKGLKLQRNNMKNVCFIVLCYQVA